MGDSYNLRQSAKNGIVWTSANQFVNYGLQFVVGIIMARLLTPSDFGITAIPAIFIAVASVFSEAGFSNALIRKNEISDNDLSTAFYYSLFVGLFCYLILFISSPIIADFYNIPILKPLMRVTALSFLLSSLMTPQNVILKRKLDFKSISVINIISKIIGSFAGIILAYIGMGLWSLVALTIISNVISCILMWIFVRWHPSKLWSKESFQYLWNYGNKIMLIGVMDQVFQNISQAVIGKIYNSAQLGVYNRAYSFAYLPSQQITGVIQNVSFPILSKIQNDKMRLSINYRRLLKSSAYIVFPIMLMVATLAKPLVIVLLTEKWIECVPYLRLVCLWGMWYPIHAINLNLLQVVGRTDLSLRLEIIKKIILVIFLVVTLPMGIYVYLLGCIVNSMIVLAINTYFTGKIINVGYFKQMKDLTPILLLSLISCIITYTAISFIDNVMLQLTFGLLLWGSAYGSFSLLFHREQLIDIIKLIRNK